MQFYVIFMSFWWYEMLFFMKKTENIKIIKISDFSVLKLLP